jgi:hypothetical protein
MFWTLKSNSPFSAPRDDTARAVCGNGAKSEFLLFEKPLERPATTPGARAAEAGARTISCQFSILKIKQKLLKQK